MAGRIKLPRTRRDKYRQVPPNEKKEHLEKHQDVRYYQKDKELRPHVHSREFFNGDPDGLADTDTDTDRCSAFDPGVPLVYLRSKSDPGTDSSSTEHWESDLDRSKSEEQHLDYDETDMACKRKKGKTRIPSQAQGAPPRLESELHQNNNSYHMKPENTIEQHPPHEDTKPDEYSFTAFDTVIYIFSIASYMFDIGCDILMSYLYYKRGHYWWFSLTLSFVLIPGITMTCFSLRWYILDHEHEKTYKKKASIVRWISRFTFLVLQIAPVLRYIDTVIYGWKVKKVDSEKKEHWFNMMLYEDTDSALLRLIESFLEAAPQLILQLYIMCQQYENSSSQGDMNVVIGQVACTLTSLCSLAWALAVYHRALRCSLPEKNNITYTSMAFYFLCQFFTIGARVIALAMFASHFHLFVFVITTAHWAAMFTWIHHQKTAFCTSSSEEVVFNMVAAAVYIFCYFNLVEGHSRLRYLFYYLIIYIENAAMMLTWYLVTHEEDIWYQLPAVATVLGGFFIGILFQGVYYIHFHPNNHFKETRIKIWVPCKELSCCHGKTFKDSTNNELKNNVTDNKIITDSLHCKISLENVQVKTVVKSFSKGNTPVYATSVISKASSQDYVDSKFPSVPKNSVNSA